MEKLAKSPEQIEEEKRQIASLRARLIDMTNRCPSSVLLGSYQKAVAWKKAAIGARKLAESKSPTLAKLQNAVTELTPYYSAA